MRAALLILLAVCTVAIGADRRHGMLQKRNQAAAASTARQFQSEAGYENVVAGARQYQADGVYLNE